MVAGRLRTVGGIEGGNYLDDNQGLVVCPDRSECQGWLEGQVYDAELPGSAATCSAADLSLSPGADAVVDPVTGRYGPLTLLPGVYLLEASAPGYSLEAADVTVEAGITITRDIGLWRPRVEAGPLLCSVVLDPGTSLTLPLYITNTGHLALEYQLLEVEPTAAGAPGAGTAAEGDAEATPAGGEAAGDDQRAAPEPVAQRAADKRRLANAVRGSLAFVLLLVLVFGLQGLGDARALAVGPGSAAGLLGLLTAPLLHGSPAHLLANASALLILGTLALAVYPRATVRALPLMWLGSGLGAWLLGEPGSWHLGASGLTHGLMFLVFVLGLLRRDRASIAAGMIAFFFYGGMLLTVLPHEPGVSWQSHLGGAIGGVLAAWLLRGSDPIPPRRRYSWEIEEEEAERAAQAERDTWEPGSPRDVPVLWNRGERRDDEPGVVLPFRRRED